MKAYPICFAPIYRDYLWGGERIAKKYGRETKEKRVAESWEIADRDEGMSVVVNGAFRGKTLRELVEEMGEDLLGEGRREKVFPLLIKILDAREHLSVQVHPDNKTAALVEGEAKSEMWYMLDAQPEAFVYAGLKSGADLKECVEIGDALEKIGMDQDDAIYVPGGCVHAIGAGCLLFEVQQNSNTTYRIYDWDRKGADGKFRPLHRDQALRVMNSYMGSKEKFEKIDSGEGFEHWSVVSSPYFQVERLDIQGKWEIRRRADSFQIFFCLQGEGVIDVEGVRESLCPGKTYLVPACFKLGEILGSCRVIRVSL